MTSSTCLLDRSSDPTCNLPSYGVLSSVVLIRPPCLRVAVLVQEMERYNRLTDVIRESLKGIDLALQGLQVMSAELDSAFRAISINQVPDLWRGASYPTLKPLAGYLEDLYKRLEMLQEWYEKGQPSVFWISGFYFVHSFLAAPLQNYARKHKVPIDEVAYDFRMMGMDPADYPAKPEDGAYIHGLFLEGCAWDPDNSVLCESEPKVRDGAQQGRSDGQPGPLHFPKRGATAHVVPQVC